MKPEAIRFFEWVHKHYKEGINGWVPCGSNHYAFGVTLKQLYNIFKSK